ncbi:MAG: patatin-like phospholipase family protein [Gemmatimonadota bacterium]|nr:patatin-like phospholipase family protein [Gemmatimonadota bacterium]
MTQKAFSLVFAGGGARGYAHAGVLRALESMGLAPTGIVGVSMGSVVAVTYGMRDDWYDALLAMDTSGVPASGTAHNSTDERSAAVRRTWSRAKAAWSLLTGWGASDEAVAAGQASLKGLIGPGKLEECRIAVTVCATDLLSGSRIELSSGPAAPAVLASSSLAGILPPVGIDDLLLVDGVYSDIAPVDVARAMGAPVVIAVDPSQPKDASPPRNGLQVVMRAMEICHLNHAHERISTADLVLRPVFDGYVDVLDFGKREMCVDAGRVATESVGDQIWQLLGGG